VTIVARSFSEAVQNANVFGYSQARSFFRSRRLREAHGSVLNRL
jgi:hypothetical protein